MKYVNGVWQVTGPGKERSYITYALSLLENTEKPFIVLSAMGSAINKVQSPEREFFIDNLLVRIHRCFWCTGLAPWEFESPFPGSLKSSFLATP